MPSTSNSFEEEIAARTAAMENLQQQLIRVENLRAEELKTAISRFEELEEALLMAEKSILAEEGRVKDLEKQLIEKNKEIEALRKEQQNREKQHNEASLVQELEKKLEIAMKQMHASNVLAKEAAAREQEIRDAAKKELEASQKLVEMANEMLSQIPVQSSTEEESDDDQIVAKEGMQTDSRELEAVLEELDLLRKELETELSAAAAATAAAEPTRVSMDIPDMLDPVQMDALRGQLSQAHKDLSASRSEEARLHVMLEKVQAELEEAKRQADMSSTVINKSAQQKYVRELEERNRELAGQMQSSNKAMEESKRLLSLLEQEYSEKFKLIDDAAKDK